MLGVGSGLGRVVEYASLNGDLNEGARKHETEI